MSRALARTSLLLCLVGAGCQGATTDDALGPGAMPGGKPGTTPPKSKPGGTGGLPAEPGASGRVDAAAPAPAEEEPAKPNPDQPHDGGVSSDARGGSTTDGGRRSSRLPPPPVPTGGPAPACAHFFCESFEAGAVGATPPGWSRNSNIAVDDSRAARGAKSLKVRNGGANPGNYISRSQAFPPGKDVVFGRLFLWFEARPASASLVHWTAAAFKGSGGPEIRVIGGISQKGFDGRNNLMFNIDPGGGEQSVEDSFPRPAVPEKVWNCLEFQLTRGAKDGAKFWWNGEERPKLEYKGDWGARFKFPTYGELLLGFATYQNFGAFEVSIDEVVIGETRIGCGP